MLERTECAETVHQAEGLDGVAVVLGVMVVIPEAVRMAEADLNPMVVIATTVAVLSTVVSRRGR